MVNSWSLLYDEMYGPDDEANLKAWKEEQLKQGKPMTDDATGITEYPPDYMYAGVHDYTGVDSMSIGESEHEKEILKDSEPITNVSLNYEELNLNIQANSPYNDGWTQEFYKEELKNMTDSRNKYHEKEILKDVEDYVSGTYNGHYTGTKHEYRNVQTIDLMASRDLASDFCQANILKYGSRYGSKEGRNKGDLLKVIHYAMLLLHFDEHYGKPKMTSGNIDHNMP